MAPALRSRIFRPATLVAGLSLAAVLAAGFLALEFGGFTAQPAAGRDEITLSGPTMGTEFSIVFLAPETSPFGDAETQAVVDAVANALADVNAKMSTYDPESELSRFNQAPAGVPVTLSDDLMHVLLAAQQVSEQTGGAFDITVGPLVNAYGFGPDKRTLEGPDDAKLEALRAKVGYTHLSLDGEARTAAKARDGIYCDLSAIAKGYGVDRVGQVLTEHGVTDFMAEIGGEVVVSGLNGRGGPWRIAIETPSALHAGSELIVPLPSGMAMATSGDYRNYYEVDGRRLSHTIDPATGRPIEHTLASVTVLHDECMYADAYATALSVMGPEKGLAFAETHGLPVYLLVRAPDGAFAPQWSEAFRPFLPASAQ